LDIPVLHDAPQVIENHLSIFVDRVIDRGLPPSAVVEGQDVPRDRLAAQAARKQQDERYNKKR